MSTTPLRTTWRGRLIQDRDRISAPVLALLLAAALLPLLLVTSRILALGGAEAMGLAAIGDWLNRVLTLSWVQADDRSVVVYILMLPLAALLTAVTRLTLGIRVLGFRAILIAIGFQEIGPLPSLLLILVIATTVVVVRPLMRRVGMPLYARVAVILCIVAMTMVVGLLAGSWLGSATLWSMAFFPVVILAMLAESVADTVARENIATAAWRTASTILLAALLAVLGQLTLLRELALACPELVITQLALVAFVSEFLDLRLLEGVQARLTSPSPVQASTGTVLIVRNRFGQPPLRRTTPAAPVRYRRASLQALVDGLRDEGLRVQVVEGDERLPQQLRAEAGVCRASGDTPLVVLNFAGGTNGAARLAQVPMLCEMLGVPYAGPSPQAPVLLDDRRAQLACLESAGLPVPRVLDRGEAEALLREPGASILVRPRFQPDRVGQAVQKSDDLVPAMEKQERWGEVLLEAQPPGRTLSVVLLASGDDAPPQMLPIVERRAGTGYRVAGGLDSATTTRLGTLAAAAASLLGCRDLARVDLKLDDSAVACITRVVAIELITPEGAVACAAQAAGLSTTAIARHLVACALQRRAATAGAPAAITPLPPTHPSLQEKRPCVTSASSVTA